MKTVYAIAACLASSLSVAQEHTQPDLNFGQYVQSLPTAQSPLNANDLLYVFQNGASSKIMAGSAIPSLNFSATAPLSLTSGVLACATCATTTNGGPLTGVAPIAVSAGGAISLGAGAALTGINDANVTLTLGGSPSTALLASASITLGWTGELSPARGGTGLGTLTAHGVLLGQGTSNVGFATIGTAGRALLDQGAGADPAFTAISGDGTLASTGALTVTKTGGTAFGTLATLNAGTGLSISGTNLNIANEITAAGPVGTATAAPVITYNAQGQLTAVTTATITPAAGSITGGADGQLLSGAGPAFTATPTLGVVGNTVGTLSFANLTSGTVTLQPATGALGSAVLTIPGATDTLAVLAASQAFTNKTYNGLTVTSTTGSLTIANGKSLTANNTLTLAGTDATAMTFPSTSATMARTDAGQTFIGAEVFSGAVTLNSALTYGGVTLSNSVTGTGSMVLSASPTVSGLTVTGSFTASGLVTNADLANPATTVNGVSCTLGSGCTVTASATAVTVGTTTVGGGTTGRVLFDNAGALGEYPITGTGSAVLGTAPTIAGGSISGLTTLAIRDTSAAFDVTIGATSSVTLTAGRALTIDMVNAARTLKLGASLTLASDPGAVTGAMKSNGSGMFSQAACADLSNGATGCSTATGTSGATIPLLNASNTWSGVQSFNSGDFALNGSGSGSLKINAPAVAGSNILTFPAGTTDFSATGGTSQVVRQSASGGALTVSQLAASDIGSGAALSAANDTNITLTLGGNPASALLATTSVTAGWTGTLAAARLNASVVQGVTNDTNITGSIATQNLTLGWAGTLAAARLNGNVVQAITNDTNVTGSITAQNLSFGWTGTLAATRGGTGNGFFAVSGPATSTKTFTFPNASANVLTDNAQVTVAQGGTGLGTLTAHSVLLGEAASNVAFATIGTTGRVLIDKGAAADPAFTVVSGDGTLASSGALTVTKTSGTAFGALATLGVGTGLASSGGNLNISIGPTTTGVNHLALWNNTTGTSLNDGGLIARLNVIDFSAGGIDITDGTTDAGPAFQAAVNACDHCIIEVPNINTRTGTTAVCYNIVTPVTGHANMSIEGTTNENAHLTGTDAGSALCMGQSSAPMFTFPGATNLNDDVAVGWAFRRLRFHGKSVAQPVIYAPEANPGRGSWSAVIEQNVFDQCNPCVYAQNGWDWWIRDNAFNRSGNGSTTAALRIFNSVQNYGGAGSNAWHITNNAFDLEVGKAIDFDSSGIGSAIQFMVVTNNKFGPLGYQSITGCVLLSSIANNVSEGSTTGLPIFDLSGTNGGTTGCGRNRITGNTLAAPGTFAISDAGSLDIIEANTFYTQGSGGAYVSLTAASSINTLTNNKTNDAPCCNSVPVVSDSGSSNSIYHNDGSDGVVTRQFLPEKLVGTQYYVPLFAANTYQIDGAWTAYTPALSCTSGTLTTSSVTGAYKRMGNTVFVTISPTITTVGTCANLQVTLPFNAFYAGSIPGTEIAVTGKVVSARFGGSSNVALIQDYSGNTVATSGYQFTINGVYPSQ